MAWHTFFETDFLRVTSAIVMGNRISLLGIYFGENLENSSVVLSLDCPEWSAVVLVIVSGLLKYHVVEKNVSQKAAHI